MGRQEDVVRKAVTLAVLGLELGLSGPGRAGPRPAVGGAGARRLPC